MAVAQLAIVKLHSIFVILGRSCAGPAQELSDPAELIGQEPACRRSPCLVTHGLVLDDLEQGGWLPVGGNNLGRPVFRLVGRGGCRPRRRCGRLLRRNSLRLGLPRIDQAARDQRLDVLAARGIDGFAAECEVRTITGNAIGRLGDVVLGPVDIS